LIAKESKRTTSSFGAARKKERTPAGRKKLGSKCSFREVQREK